MAGISIQGWIRTESICWVSFSSTPQLTAGGSIPSPRKLRVVSPRMAKGTARVATTMMWLAALGSMWVVMIRKWEFPASRAAEM